ncbi:MAG: Asp-tRNA(Asn)/Glu-tRNA(Gln) amidotransferase subunit GatB [Clostridiales bacterium]|nr:Asp-tRNA(Asn)/Glu-tRNA(Gln) amidotransferase subunit GatB [Clostridiales bacterium]HOB37060.1 Asp-tRNA(Asn)/Glu-tRNA(Gln) amidotransferase subunit GatB [Candidatus Avimonas sp.]HQD38522.1 Asp-tRNA(Asn)/Glu-tRNA(Gln) amidotransferase subunit GatB [Candidatus Avimonas sp.]
MDYETIIGLEIHAELSTESKIFCSCSTEFGADVNTHTCPVCTGMPGVLPVLNKKAVEYAIMAGLAMNCNITRYGKQDRKNYFYPDLPKGYQISQYDLPICYGGYMEIEADGQQKKIGITRIHIEEDAGKLIHDDFLGVSLVDYNRAGVPLIEIVTEPDVRSAGEAKAFLEKVKSILEYTGVSDCKMQEGSLRCDINLSVRPMGQKELGTRTEIKNINSFSAAVRAIEFERSRQIGLISAGKEVALATLRWDDENGIGYEMRSKEEAHDYRYFPEPDLAPVVIDDGWIEKIKNSLPELPDARKERYVSDFGLPEYDAAFITASRKLADYFEKAVELGAPPKIASNWIMGDISRLLKDRGLEDIPFAPEYLVKTIDLIEKGVVSTTAAKRIVAELFDGEKDPEQIAKEAGLIQVSDESELALLVKQVIDENPKAVAEVRAGKEKAMGFLIGQAMRVSKGSANPRIISRLVRKMLGL